eukprot:101215_1
MLDTPVVVYAIPCVIAIALIIHLIRNKLTKLYFEGVPVVIGEWHFEFVCSNEGLLKDYGVKKPSHRHAIVKEIQQILSVEGTAQIRDGDLRNILEPCGSNSMSLLQYLDELSAAGFTTNTKLRTLTAERLKQNDIKMSVFHTKELLKRIAQLQLSSDYRLKP